MKRTPPKQPQDCGKIKKYEMRAIGWAVEVTAHRLSPRQTNAVREWLDKNADQCMGNMEEVLEEYNCYNTNLWQSGCVPLAKNNGFVVLGEDGQIVLGIPELGRKKGEGMVVGKISEVFKAQSKEKNILVYFEETKGISAVWKLASESVPDAKDFTFRISKIAVGGESIEYIESALFRGVELERDYEGEELVGKAAYSQLV